MLIQQLIYCISALGALRATTLVDVHTTMSISSLVCSHDKSCARHSTAQHLASYTIMSFETHTHTHTRMKLPTFYNPDTFYR